MNYPISSLTAVAITTLLGPSAIGCAQRPATPEARQAYTRDSAQYVKDSTHWARSLFVLDSISRSIDTDSLYRLTRAVLAAEKPAPIYTALSCESARIVRRYGSIPADMAIRRMNDTLRAPADERRWQAMVAKLDALPIEERVKLVVGKQTCGPSGPMAPPKLDGVLLDVMPGRPTRARPPG